MTAQVTAAPPVASQPAVMKIDDPSGLEPCDRCGASGLWRIVFERGELVFCGHHAVEHGFVPRTASHAVYQDENKKKDR